MKKMKKNQQNRKKKQERTAFIFIITFTLRKVEREERLKTYVQTS